MKITVKKYQEITERKRQLNNEIRNFEDGRDWAEYEAMKNEVSEIEQIIEKLPTVSISFMCGSRIFYRNVIIIGKTMFDGKDKVTKSNGYRAVEIIPEITDKMKEAMISDSYYY